MSRSHHELAPLRAVRTREAVLEFAAAAAEARSAAAASSAFNSAASAVSTDISLSERFSAAVSEARSAA